MALSIWRRSASGAAESCGGSCAGCTIAVVVMGGAYAIGGLVVGSRVDVLGAFWFVCLLGFLRWGPSRPLYVGAFLVVSYLEILGTSLGTWEWQAHDPTGLCRIGNHRRARPAATAGSTSLHCSAPRSSQFARAAEPARHHVAQRESRARSLSAWSLDLG